MSELDERIARQVARREMPQRGRNAFYCMIILFVYALAPLAVDFFGNGMNLREEMTSFTLLSVGLLIVVAWNFRILERLKSSGYSPFYKPLTASLILCGSLGVILFLHARHEQWAVSAALLALTYGGLGLACKKMYRMSAVEGLSMAFLGLLLGGFLGLAYLMAVAAALMR